MSNLPTAATAERFAATFVALHNAAAAEYKQAFRAIGARLWHDDSAHPLKAESQAFIASAVATGCDSYDIARPLTVLDGFRNNPAVMARRHELNQEVDRICRHYGKLWQAAKREILA